MSRAVLIGVLAFWTVLGVVTGLAAAAVDPDPITGPTGSAAAVDSDPIAGAPGSSATAGSGAAGRQPSYRGQAAVATLAQRGHAARRAGSLAVARAGYAIVDARLAPSREGTVVAHALTAEVVARTAPDTAAPAVVALPNPNRRGGPLVLQATGPAAGEWIEVLLPVRPNGTTGWVRRSDVELTRNPYRIEVDASAHRLTVFKRGRVELTTTVAIGTGDTPTPIGDFYLIELLRPSDPTGLYGPYAYGLSGYSDTLDSYNGGRGVIGIHGTDQPGLLGQDVSHGCVRVANATIEDMARFLPLGTPVSIFRPAPAAGPATPSAPSGTVR